MRGLVTYGSVGWSALLWPVVSMGRAPRTPRPPSGSGGGSEHWNSDAQVGFKRSTLVQIRHHRKVPGHVEAVHENGLNVVSIHLVACERDPRLVVAFRIILERRLQHGIFPMRGVLRHQCRPTGSGELE